MLSRFQSSSRSFLGAACVVAVFGIGAVHAAQAQQADAAFAGATDQQIKSWHENLRNYAPLEKGCFQTSYPSVQWQKVSCGAKPLFVAAHPQMTQKAIAVAMTAAAHGGGAPAQTAGNGVDYVAQTAGITNYGSGSFPTVSNVTSEKGKGVAAYGGGGLLGTNEFSIQLNTDINPSATACSAFGYSSCYVWEQFVYSTAYQRYPAQVFIQNWVFPSQTDYNRRGCPSGWQDASSSGSPACYANSNATNVPSVAATSLGSVKLSGSVSGATDTAIFTYGSTAYSASEADSTVHVGSWWKQSEFNVVGNAGGSEAVFNKGASLTVNLVVKDGSTSAPKCVSNAGTTGESNNLNLGSCAAIGGSSPAISFTESD